MKNDEQKTMHIQLLNQQVQNILLQKENLKVQKAELEESLNSIKEKDEIYKAIGMLIIKKNYIEISKELKEQVEDFDSKIKSLELREKQLQDKLKNDS